MSLQKNNKGSNGSGKGKNAPVPDIILKRFNWGAFFLSFIWGIGNRTYITFLILLSGIFAIIPIIGALVPLGMCIWFGIMGNRWAWQNKEFASIEEFERIQKNWAIAGLTISVVLTIVSVMTAIMLGSVMMEMLQTQGTIM